jgi:hypothetical protein
MTAPDNRERQRETIEALQEAIERLNALVSQLNTGSAEALPEREAIENLLTSTRQVADSLVPLPQYEPITTAIEEDEFADIEEILTPVFPAEKAKGIEEQKFNIAEEEEERGFLGGILTRVRSILPNSLRDALPDWLLGTILAGGIVAILVFGIVNLPKNPAEIASNPLETTPEDTPEVIETPPELKAPDVAIPVPIRKLEPKLTPEQSLVAAIQEEIIGLTSRYPEGLISTVEADFLGSRLTVFVGDSWYELKATQQDKFADSILKRAVNLDFRRWEVKDTSGTLIARSPVIGDRPVIIARTKSDRPS